MHFTQLDPSLFNVTPEGETARPVTFKVLFGKRHQALLVPIDANQAHKAINLFVSHRIRNLLAHFLTTFDRHIPWLNILPSITFKHFPLTVLFGETTASIDDRLATIAMAFGNPGALQKMTIYCPDIDLAHGKIAKIALVTTANEAIIKESYWLEKLNQGAITSNHVPQLLQQSSHASMLYNRAFFTMSTLPTGQSSHTFQEAHYGFLRTLARQNPLFMTWKDSVSHQRLKKRLQAIEATIGRETAMFWHDILIEIEQLTGPLALPNLMVHGDFAPWNLREFKQALLVFDWEYAQMYGNPLQDYIHFHLVPQVLRHKNVSHKKMACLLTQTTRYADKQFGLELGIGQASGALMMHYLLDTMTFYVKASGYLDMEHPVIRQYTRLLKERDAWLLHNVKPDSRFSKKIDYVGNIGAM